MMQHLKSKPAQKRLLLHVFCICLSICLFAPALSSKSLKHEQTKDYATMMTAAWFDNSEGKVLDTTESSKFVRAEGSGFVYQGKPYRFVGVNSRSLLWPATDPDITKEKFQKIVRPELEAAKAIGAKVVRIYLAKHFKDTYDWNVEELAIQVRKRLEWLFEVNNIEKLGLKFLLCFTDSIRDENLEHIIPGDEEYYEHDIFGDLRLNRQWYINGYNRKNSPYKFFVYEIVAAFHQHQEIFGWELGNEFAPAIKKVTANDINKIMLDFSYEVGCWINGKGCESDNDRIKAKQLVSTGFISVWHATNGQGTHETISDFYDSYCSPNGICRETPFDYITVHAYNNRQAVDRDGDQGDLCDRGNEEPGCPDEPHNEKRDIEYSILRKPLVFSEAGFDGGHMEYGSYYPGGWWRAPFSPIPIFKPRFRICPAKHDIIGRAPAIRRTMAVFFDVAGGDGYMQWNFLPNTPIGLCDPKSMTDFNHFDFDFLSMVYASQAERLAHGDRLGFQGRPSSACAEMVASPSAVILRGSSCEAVTAEAEVELYSLSNELIRYEIDSDVDWLEIKPKVGTLPYSGASDTLSLTAQCPAEPGTYEAKVTVNGNVWPISSGHTTTEKFYVTLQCEGDGVDTEWSATGTDFDPDNPPAKTYLEGELQDVTDGNDATYLAAVLPEVFGGIHGPRFKVYMSRPQDIAVKEITVTIHVDGMVSDADIHIRTFKGPRPISHSWYNEELDNGDQYTWILDEPVETHHIIVEIDALHYHDIGAINNPIGFSEVRVYSDYAP